MLLVLLLQQGEELFMELVFGGGLDDKKLNLLVMVASAGAGVGPGPDELMLHLWL